MSAKPALRLSSKVSKSKETENQVLWKLFAVSIMAKMIIHLIATGALQFCTAHQMKIVTDFCEDHWLSHRFHHLFKWDGFFFMHIVFYGYTSVQQLAFYPGFPYLVSFLVKIWRMLNGHPWVDNLVFEPHQLFQAIVTGLSLNLIMYLANQYMVFKLALMRGYSLQSAKRIGLFFAFAGPAFFHLVFYSESLYLFVALSSQFLIEKWVFIPKKTMSELSFGKYLFLTVLLAYSGFVRSIGLLNVAYIGYPLLIELFVCFRNPDSLKIPGKKVGKRLLTIIGRGLFALAMFLAPTVFMVLKSRQTFCHKHDEDYQIPSYCHTKFGFFYSYVQQAFWEVVFLRQLYHGELYDYFAALNTIPILFYYYKKFFKENNWKDIISFNWTLSTDREAIFDPKIRQFPEFAINIISCRVFYLYAHYRSLERFWVANYYYGFMLNDFQTMINTESEKIAISAENKDKTQTAGIFKKISVFFLRYLNTLNMLYRFFVTPYCYSTGEYPGLI